MGTPRGLGPAVDDALYDAGYQAELTRSLGRWLLACVAALALPIFWGAFGIVPLVGAIVLFLVIPLRAAWWARRYRSLPREHEEMRRGSAAVRAALLMWMSSPLVLAAVALLMSVLARSQAD